MGGAYGPKVNNVFSAPDSVTVNNTGGSAEVVEANFDNRRGLILTNTHASKIIYLGFGQDAVVGKGIVLFPKAIYDMAINDFYGGSIEAIADSDGATLAIQEVVGP